MKSFKIKIPNPYISKLVQEKAFELGYGWMYGGGSCEDFTVLCKYWIFHENGEMSQTELETSHEEIIWHDFLLLESAEEEEMTVRGLVNKYISNDMGKSSYTLGQWLIGKYGNYKLVKP